MEFGYIAFINETYFDRKSFKFPFRKHPADLPWPLQNPGWSEFSTRRASQVKRGVWNARRRQGQSVVR